MIDDVLRLSRLEEAVVPFEKVDLFSLSKEIVSTFEAEAQKRQVTLLIAGHPAFLEGNSVILEQMVANLCENAIKYNRPNGIVTVGIKAESDSAILYVKDTGMGIQPENWENIFNPFVREDKSRSRAMGGAGLGLALVRDIARQHGGNVRIVQSSDTGTEVVLTLPMKKTVPIN